MIRFGKIRWNLLYDNFLWKNLPFFFCFVSTGAFYLLRVSMRVSMMHLKLVAANQSARASWEGGSHRNCKTTAGALILLWGAVLPVLARPYRRSSSSLVCLELRGRGFCLTVTLLCLHLHLLLHLPLLLLPNRFFLLLLLLFQGQLLFIHVGPQLLRRCLFFLQLSLICGRRRQDRRVIGQEGGKTTAREEKKKKMFFGETNDQLGELKSPLTSTSSTFVRVHSGF